MSTVIIGAGVIGTATAYYLSQWPAGQDKREIHLVDISSRVFSSASGCSGAIVAADGMPAAELGRYSWDLHCKLAAEHAGRENWGFSPMIPGRLQQGLPSRATGSHEADGPQVRPRWLADGLSTVPLSGGPRAIIDPKAFSQFLLQASEARGVKLHHPASPVAVIENSADGTHLIEIFKDGAVELLPCHNLVLAAGCWTPKIFTALFPVSPLHPLPITPLSGHFILFRSPRHTVDDEKAYNGYVHGIWSAASNDKKSSEQEEKNTDNTPFRIFSRVGGDLYVTGISSASHPLPEVPEASQVSAKSIDQLCRVAGAATGLHFTRPDLPDPKTRGVIAIRSGVAFRPMTPLDVPIIAELQPGDLYGPNIPTLAETSAQRLRVFVNAGHGGWGMSLSLGSGKVLSDLIKGKEPDIEIKYSIEAASKRDLGKL